MNARYISWLLLSLLPNCAYHKYVKRVTLTNHALPRNSSSDSPPPITIWIHGTRFIRRPLFHSFFGGIPRLRLAQELAPDYYLYDVVQNLHAGAPHQFPLETFYLFGWSGKLRAWVREQAAEQLYESLKDLIEDYKKNYGIEPIIRIISHSHGGTVALNLARVKESDPPPFYISELILLACPVQANTKKYLEDDMFCRTYSLYSSLDMVQVLAPQLRYHVYRCKKGRIRSRILWPSFSDREFEHHPKLSQVRLKINGRALFHSEFTRPHFAKLLPHILYVIDKWHQRKPPIGKSRLLAIYTREKKKEIKEISAPLKQ